MSEDILTLPPPPADARISYGAANQQFGDLRLPHGRGPHPVVLNIHGGFWRNKYDLTHAGHLCATLTAKGLATWNLEYRRVGDDGGGWPGTFRDIVDGYRFLGQLAEKYSLDKSRVLAIGHSAGGHLALCLAAHEPSIKRAISLGGVVDLEKAWNLHLGSNAVRDFLRGTPEEVLQHYQEADPMRLAIRNAEQWLVHGALDDIVPADLSRAYCEQKQRQGENVHLVEIERVGHFDVIDPRSTAWVKVEQTVVNGTRS